MRVVVTGASGNVGTSVLRRLVEDPDVSAVTGLARRIGSNMPFPQVRWVSADIATTALESLFEGADAVIHLAWAIQPSHDESRLWSTNVLGSRRVFEAAASAGVGSLIYASSIGAYSPGPQEPRVDESWPVEGVPTSFYSRHKATVEWMLDRFEQTHPGMRVARLRPALTFKREAGSGIRRLFMGRFFPTRLLRSGALPFLPLPTTLSLQAVHTEDVAAAYWSLLKSDASGAFNVSAEPVIDGQTIALLLGTRLAPTPFPVLRMAAAAAWRAHAQPTPEGWLDMGEELPRMDTGRIRRELDWRPEIDATSAFQELIEGLVEKAQYPTPALSRWGRPVGLVPASAGTAERPLLETAAPPQR